MLADRKSADYRGHQHGNAESQREIGDSRPSVLETTDPGPPGAIWK